MESIITYPVISQVTLFVLLAFMTMFAVLTFAWQILVLMGRCMHNPDGSADDWHEQKVFFGIALADVFIACPVTITGVVLILTEIRSGYFILSLAGFWFLWANIMTTSNSLRFEGPKITPVWLFTFPLGIFVGAGYLVWVVFHYAQVIG